jgi:hypothetical protein
MIREDKQWRRPKATEVRWRLRLSYAHYDPRYAASVVALALPNAPLAAYRAMRAELGLSRG